MKDPFHELDKWANTLQLKLDINRKDTCSAFSKEELRINEMALHRSFSLKKVTLTKEWNKTK